jgi:hypothetical protein
MTQQERDDRYLAKKVRRDLAWTGYMMTDSAIDIPRHPVIQMMNGMDASDWMDACSPIAHAGWLHYQRIKHMRLGQSEALELPKPLPSKCTS